MYSDYPKSKLEGVKIVLEPSFGESINTAPIDSLHLVFLIRVFNIVWVLVAIRVTRTFIVGLMRVHRLNNSSCIAHDSIVARITCISQIAT